MSIEDIKEKINSTLGTISGFLKNGSTDGFNKIITIGIIILVGTFSFGLGRMSTLQENIAPIRISNISSQTNVPIKKDAQTASAIVSQPINSGATNISGNSGQIVVGSKNSDKYHYVWCSGAKRISEENKIVFNSSQEAEKAGYTLAGNCKPR